MHTVGDLKNYVAAKLKVADPERLRFSYMSMNRPFLYYPMSLSAANEVSIKAVGHLDTYTQFVVGWKNGTWVRNLLPGMNYGRSL